MVEYVFAIVLNLPGLCNTSACEAKKGEVRAEITTVGEESDCKRIRKLVVQQMGGEANIKGTVTPCEAKK